MGNLPSIGHPEVEPKINFEDIQYMLKNKERFFLINTLPEHEQDCLIPYTVPANQEERMVNQLIQRGDSKEITVIIYGRHCNDSKMYSKYQQFVSLGFYSVFIYTGGLFEWLMLQDIYGSQEFPTTGKQLDLLKYKPTKRLGVSLLEY